MSDFDLYYCVTLILKAAVTQNDSDKCFLTLMAFQRNCLSNRGRKANNDACPLMALARLYPLLGTGTLLQLSCTSKAVSAYGSKNLSSI